jgi:DNA polymerase-1
MAGKPFANPNGTKPVLEHLLALYGVERNEVITTNVVLCQTDDPPTEAIQACSARLESEIANCELVLAAGVEAITRLTKYRAVSSARPYVHYRSSVSGIRQRVIATTNPALVIRDADSYPDMVDDFRRAFDPPPPAVFPDVEIINDPARVSAVLERWNNTEFDLIGSDLEWRSTNNEITCAGFSKDGRKSVVFGREGIAEGTESRGLLKSFYERTDIRFVWHNGKADTKVLRLSGIGGRVDEDTFLQSYALDERPGYHSLEYLLSTRFAWPDYEPASVKSFKKTGEFFGKTPQEKISSERELYKYNGWDTAGTVQLYDLLDPKLDTDRGGEVRTLYERLLYASERFTTVELNGFNYDIEEACNINDRAAIPATINLTNHLREVSGHALLNPNSPKQLSVVYYDDNGLKHKLRDMGKKKFARSTGKEIREEILEGRTTCKIGHKEKLLRFAEAHAQYAKIIKLRGNYLEGLAIRTKRDGKLYCRFNPCGTVSGRSSSNDPNLQNIAREGYAEIPGIRTLFTASDGCVIVSADYSQAELRTCAKLSGDANLLAIYRDSSRSLHKERAAAFYGEEYTYEQYVKSKNINFGVTYGQGAKAFAQMYHMDETEAQNYINSWWDEFTELREWTIDLQGRAIKDGYIRSPFGHKRRFSLITNDNINDVKREAVNALPQNIAAWLTISSLCDLVDSGVRVVATVHDSIVADVPIGEVDRVARLMTENMALQPIKQLGWDSDDIPFSADISVGPNWGALEDYEMELIAA